MFSTYRSPIVTCLILALAIGIQGQAGQKPSATPRPTEHPLAAYRSFSARMTGGLGREEGRQIYRLGNLMRADFGNYYRVTDLKTRTMWSVAGKSCEKFAGPDASSFPFASYADFEAKREETNESENIDGHSSKVERVTLTPPDGGPMVITMKLWKARDLQMFPVKIEIEAANNQKVTINYSDVSLQPPDPKLFSHPENCSQGAPPASPPKPR